MINFPPLPLSPAARQSLFSRSDKQDKNIHVLESVPNPSLVTSYLDGHGPASGTAYGEEVYVGRTGGPYGDGGAGGLRNGNVKLRVPAERRLVCVRVILLYYIHHACSYYAQTPAHVYPPEVHDYNARFTKTLEAIKRRHDPTVTTVAQGVLEWQRAKGIKPGMGLGLSGYGHGGDDVQAWLDRFYMSRIGIRFLIGQREWPLPACLCDVIDLHRDVALNTQQPHKDYVGIICTKAVRFYFACLSSHHLMHTL